MKIKDLIHFLKSLPSNKEIEELEMKIDQQIITIQDIIEAINKKKNQKDR